LVPWLEADREGVLEAKTLLDVLIAEKPGVWPSARALQARRCQPESRARSLPADGAAPARVIPAYFVPIFLMVHATALLQAWRLRREARTRG
jgi:hypothetical protein